VLVVMPGLTPDAGAEQSMVSLLPLLVDGGFSVHVALLTPRQSLVPVLERAGVVIHDISSATTTTTRTRRLSAVIAATKPNLVHAVLYEAAVPAQIAARKAGVPVLVTWAVTLYDGGHFSESQTNHFKLRSAQAVEIALARLARTRFHAVTEGVATVNASSIRVSSERMMVGERGRAEPEQVHVNGHSEPRPPGLPESGRIVLAVGRQEPQKGYGSLLEQFERLGDRCADAHLVIAGRPGSESVALHRAQRAMRHGDRVHFLGQRDDVSALLACADVVVCSSWREGAAGALIEAMSVGVPIVTVQLDSLIGVIRNDVNGLMVSRDRLAESIEMVLNDADLAKRLGAGSRKQYEERFTLERSAARMSEIYTWAASTSE